MGGWVCVRRIGEIVVVEEGGFYGVVEVVGDGGGGRFV